MSDDLPRTYEPPDVTELGDFEEETGYGGEDALEDGFAFFYRFT